MGVRPWVSQYVKHLRQLLAVIAKLEGVVAHAAVRVVPLDAAVIIRQQSLLMHVSR